MSYQVDIKLIQSFKAGDYNEMEKVFKAYDKNKNGLIESDEFLEIKTRRCCIINERV